MDEQKPTKPLPICRFCKRPIKGRVYFQANLPDWTVHKNCRIVIKPDKRYGGGI